jgi:hypothetical protein
MSCLTTQDTDQTDILRRTLSAFSITSNSTTGVFGPLRDTISYDSTSLDKHVRICITVNMSFT